MQGSALLSWYGCMTAHTEYAHQESSSAPSCPEFVLGSVILAVLIGLTDDLSPSGGQADIS